MTRQIPTPNRRNVLKTLGGGAAAAAVGGAGLLAMSGGASASGTFDYGDVTITSDDGTVEYVAIYGDSKVTWDGFEREATQFSLTIDATLKDANGDTIHGPLRIYETGATTTAELDDGTVGKVELDSDWGNYDESLSGPGTHGYIKSGIGLYDSGTHKPAIDWDIVGDDASDNYGLPLRSIPADELEADTDDSTAEFNVVVSSTYAWYDSGDTEIHSETFDSKVDVTVNNEPTTAGSTDGGGSDGATGA